MFSNDIFMLNTILLLCLFYLSVRLLMLLSPLNGVCHEICSFSFYTDVSFWAQLLFSKRIPLLIVAGSPTFIFRVIEFSNIPIKGHWLPHRFLQHILCVEN